MFARKSGNLGILIKIPIMILLVLAPFSRDVLGENSGDQIAILRQGSRVEITMNTQVPVEWTLSDPRKVVCARGRLNSGSHTLVFPKVSTADDVVFAMGSLDRESLRVETIKGVKTPSIPAPIWQREEVRKIKENWNH
jgi:hypothetical protein